MGKAVAKELLLGGDHVDAERALRIGLVNHAYPADQFEERVRELAERIAAMNR